MTGEGAADNMKVPPAYGGNINATYPKELNGRAMLPVDGIPLTPAFEGKSLGRTPPIFIEHETMPSSVIARKQRLRCPP